MDVAKIQGKDKWDKLKISAELVLALAALIFTVTYNQKQHEIAEANLRLAASNIEIAKAQVKSALLPALSSNNPKQRSIALILAEALDQYFAVQVIKVLSVKDADQDVRTIAGSTLASLSRNAPEEVKQQAAKALDQYDIMNGLRTKGLLEKLHAAEAYRAGGNISGEEQALRLYREVVNQLPSRARNKLNQKLLAAAEKDFKENHTDDALNKYHALFADYLL